MRKNGEDLKESLALPATLGGLEVVCFCQKATGGSSRDLEKEKRECPQQSSVI